jgi:hypothetical protein
MSNYLHLTKTIIGVIVPISRATPPFHVASATPGPSDEAKAAASGPYGRLMATFPCGPKFPGGRAGSQSNHLFSR